MKAFRIAVSVFLSIVLVSVVAAADARPVNAAPAVVCADTSPAAGVQCAFDVLETIDAVDANIGNGKCDRDAVMPGDQCTLRAAIQEANAQTTVDSIAIYLKQAATYQLTIEGRFENASATGDLDITTTRPLAILRYSYPDLDLILDPVIDGGKLDRVFDILSGAQVSMTDVTIRNGKASVGQDFGQGGGIWNHGFLWLTGVLVTENQSNNDGGGIFNGAGIGGGPFNTGKGTLTGRNVTVVANAAARDGGGILNFGEMSLRDSSVKNNTAGRGGGGIYNNNYSPELVVGMTLTDMRINGNKSGGNGGGILNSGLLDAVRVLIEDNEVADFIGNGGGIALIKLQGEPLFSAVLVLDNSTITKNRAPRGKGGNLFEGAGTLTATLNATITGGRASENTGGGVYIEEGAVVEAENTIIADNYEDLTLNNCGGPGSITSLGHNLEDANTCGFSFIGDLPYTNPLLRPLADNGGPTETLALLLGSPAIDAASCGADEPADQRGFERTVDGPDADTVAVCDIGAYEFGAELLPPVGGVVEVLSEGDDAPLNAGNSGNQPPPLALLAGVAAALTLLAGGWYLRRRVAGH